MRRFKSPLGVGLLAGLMAAVAPVPSAPASPLGGGFTYQGQLRQNGAPLNGTVDVTFALYDAEQNGTLLGTQTFNGLQITDGLFTVLLNDAGQFGPNALNGDARWLQIIVNGHALNPRQPLTAAPYALKVPGVTGHSLGAPDGSPAQAVVVDNNGRVGIGTANPEINLHVIGETWFDSGRVRGYDQFEIHSSQQDGAGASILARGIFYPATGERGSLLFNHGNLTGAAPDSSIYFRFMNNNQISNQMIIRSNGNVGIGTTSPGQKLTVAGTIESSSGGFRFPDGSVQSVAAPWTVAGTNATFSLGGNLGIGQSNPTFKLDLAGTGNGVARFRSSDAFGATLAIESATGGRNWSLISTGSGHAAGGGRLVIRDVGAGQDRATFDTSGRLGLGTAAPLAGLHINSQPSGAGGTLALEGVNHTYISFYPDGASAGRKAWLGFGTGASNDVEIMNEVANGNIRLLTNGTGKTQVNVLEILGGADIAEPFNVAASGQANSDQETGLESARHAEVVPGMVVSIDPARIGELRICDRAYDTTVAGVISGAGGVSVGMTLKQEGTAADGKHPVALTGRVWCWCDADAGGAIRAGDLLTTSSTPGHAMKVTDHAAAQGATIGKAMSSLESGRGLVLVLVNLQ